MSLLLLDTSAYSAFKRGHDDAVEAMRRSDRLALPSIVIGELLAGFELGSRRQQNLDELTGFLASSRVSILNVTQATGQRYAHIFAYLRREGTPIPTNDIWIAALAMEHGIELLTTDSHFHRVPHILVQELA
jgi:tRNA(fMet)-specific endonuclease VapC